MNQQLQFTLLKLNLQRTKTIIYIIFFMIAWTSFINIVSHSFIEQFTLPFYNEYIILYGAMLLLNVVAWYIIVHKKLRLTIENYKKVMLFYGTYHVAMLLLLTIISFHDAFYFGHAALFQIYFLVAVILLNTPSYFTVPVAFILTAPIIYILGHTEAIEYNYMLLSSGNIIISVALGLICSYFVYKARIQSIVQQFELDKKNEETKVLLQKLHAQNKTLTDLMQHDALTGLYNRHAFNQYMVNLQNTCREPVTFIMMDIDCFKLYNDHYGHIEGDRVLQTVAARIQAIADRRSDFLTRWGGEELMYITTNGDAEQIAQQIQQTIADAAIPHAYSTVTDHVTLSIGVYTSHLQPDDELSYHYELADQALYVSKHNGRNQYTIEAAPAT